MNYKPGEIVETTYYRKPVRNLLLKYLGEFRSKDQAIFKLKNPLPDGRNLVKYEVWDVQNMETGVKDIQKIPVYMYDEDPEQTSIGDRQVTINDINEVTSLLDSYDCWVEYCKLEHPEDAKRDRYNFHLEIINQRHLDQMVRLRELDSNTALDVQFRVGVRYKLIQKESPDHYARRDLLNWKKEFPALFTKLIDYVYKNNNDLRVVTSGN